MLIRFSQPGILPRYGDVLKVSSIMNIRAPAVAELQGLMLAHWSGNGETDPRIGLQRVDILNVGHTGAAAVPEVSIQGDPESRLNVVAQMCFERQDWILGLRLLRRRREREERVVIGEEPYGSVTIEYPVAPAAGIAQLGFEGPAVGAPV